MEARRTLALSRVAITWLTGVLLAVVAGRVYVPESIDTILAVAATWPLGYFAVAGVYTGFGNLPYVVRAFLLGFLLLAGASAIASVEPNLSQAYFVLTLAVLVIAGTLGTQLTDQELLGVLRRYAAVATGVLVAFAAFEYEAGTRLGNAKGILNPNAIALMAASAAVCGMALSNRGVGLTVTAVNLGILVLTGSRGGLLAAVIGITAVLVTELRHTTTVRRTVLAIGIMALGVLGSAYVDSIKSVLAVDDPYRGLGTGFTGRADAWQEALELFAEYPFLGVGFRAHEGLMTTQSSAHNGYLAMLAEIGIFGFLCIAAVLVGAVRYRYASARRLHNVPSLNPVLFGVVLGYLVTAAFERYLLNLGNPASLLFMVALLRYPSAVGEAWWRPCVRSGRVGNIDAYSGQGAPSRVATLVRRSRRVRT